MRKGQIAPSRPMTTTKLPFTIDQKPIIHGVVMKSASLQKLVERVVLAFDEGGGIYDHSCLPRVVFLVHRWFTPSATLAFTFVDYYTKTILPSPCACSNFPTDQILEISACYRCCTALRVCQAFRFWSRTFPEHFENADELRKICVNFQQQLVQDNYNDLADIIDMNSLIIPTTLEKSRLSQRLSGSSSRSVLVFDHLTPENIADHLTYLEYRIIRRISVSDYKQYVLSSSISDVPQLQRSVVIFNGISQWIQCTVLSRVTPQERADIITRFVQVADRLFELCNFNTLMAVVGGLTHSAISRLKQTTTCLSMETQGKLSDYSNLLTFVNNFSNYRKLLAKQSNNFYIPIIGVHLKDLIQVNSCSPDWPEQGVLNVRKMAQLSLTFETLVHIQTVQLPVETNLDLANTLKLALDVLYTDDEIHDLSLSREARQKQDKKGASPEQQRAVVFADWVQGVQRPDPSIVQKHINAMVEAVIKNYDTDNDGHISATEFESIKSNFPFIESFNTLDTNQDGLISKEEMQEYFEVANSSALKTSFKHDFTEMTYFKPAFCVGCTGLLWGIIKQGWKCRECGINAHKQCKDLVVLECRKANLKNGGSQENDHVGDFFEQREIGTHCRAFMSNPYIIALSTIPNTYEKNNQQDGNFPEIESQNL